MKYKIPEKYSDSDFINAFDKSRTVMSGLTLSDVSNVLGCCKDTARTRLNLLVDKGELKKAKLGMNWIYWRE